MTRDDARAMVRRCLDDIAPGAGADTLASDADLRETLDLDSMDVLDLVAAVCEEAAIDIPDRDVPGLVTLDAFAEHVAAASA